MTCPPIGVILAGGKSSRMGRDIATVEIGGLRLIDRVADRLRPQVSRLVIPGPDDYGLGVDRVCDHDDVPSGPAAAIFSLARALLGAAEGFVTAAVDALLFPDDLLGRLFGERSAIAADSAKQTGAKPDGL